MANGRRHARGVAALLGAAIVMLGAGCSRKEAEKPAPSEVVFPPEPPPPCEALQGAPVQFEASVMQLGPQVEGTSARVDGVISSPAEVSSFFYQPLPPSLDFSRHRLALVDVGYADDAKIRWVVETNDEVLVGLTVYAYCGGVPPSGAGTEVRVVLPASKKPVRFVKCPGVFCSGLPRP